MELVLASLALPDDVRRDSSGELLVLRPHPGFATYLHVGSAQIRGYGIRGPLVLAALLQMLAAVAQDCVDGSRRAAVRGADRPGGPGIAAGAHGGVRPGPGGRCRPATAVVNQPGTLAPPPPAFGMVAAAAAAISTGASRAEGSQSRAGSD